MDGQVFGPYSYKEVVDLGILSDTMICTDEADSQWKEAHEYSEFRNLFVFTRPQQPEETTDNINDDSCGYPSVDTNDYDDTDEEYEDDETINEEYYEDEPSIETMQKLLFYKQKRKAALIGVLTLGLAGLAVVGVRNTWRGNIFSGTSMAQHEGVGFILKIISFMFLSVLVAIPFFIISLIELIYYSIKIKKLK